MGKIWDFLNSRSWEEYQRIQLYKKAGKFIEGKTSKDKKKRLLVINSKNKKRRIFYVNGKGEVQTIQR